MTSSLRASMFALVSGILVAGCVGERSSTDQSPGTGSNQGSGSGTTQAQVGYQETDLVSDQPNVAIFTDPNLVNSWGMVVVDGKFWIADNGTGFISVFDGAGRALPQNDMFNLGAGISGMAANHDKSAFIIHDDGKTVGLGPCPNGNAAAATIIVVSEGGQIFALNPDVSATTAVLAVDHSGMGAVYKGAAIIHTSTGAELLAADFANNRIDVFDASFRLISSKMFVMPPVSTNLTLSPFNVAAVADGVIVTYAVPDADRMDDVKGAGNGLVVKFDFEGNVIWQFQGNELNSPWGVAVANVSLGTCDTESMHGNALVIGNFGDGAIHALDPASGRLLGALLDTQGAPLAIDGLWSLVTGSDGSSLFFTAGPDDEMHGLFGVLRPVATAM